MDKITRKLYEKLKKYDVIYSKYEKDDTYEIFLNTISSKFNTIFSYDIQNIPDCVIYKTYKTEGGFFESSRLFNYGFMFYSELLIVYRIVETTGWDKEQDFILYIKPDDILKPSIEIYKGIGNSGDNLPHLNLNLHKNYISQLMKDAPDFFDEYSIKPLFNESNLFLINFISPEVPLEDLVNYLIAWKKEYKSKLNDMSTIFYELESLDSKDINPAMIDHYSFKEDPSYLYLLSKCYDNEQSLNFLIDSLNKFIDIGSKVDNYGEFLFERLLMLLRYYKSEEDQLEFLNKYKDCDVISSDLFKNTALALQKSIVNKSLSNLKSTSNKILVINEENRFFKSTNFITLPYQDIPSGLQFPPGHPIAKQTYVQHPILLDKFLPIDEYESTILKDKIDEFKYLVQCLGAISVEYILNEQVSNNIREKNTATVQLDTSVKFVRGGVHVHNDVDSKSKSNNENIRKEIQCFHPMGLPFIPSNLIWFEHEISWQRLAKQRLDGNILNHSEVIKISKFDTIYKLDLNKIDAEVKSLVNGINLQFDSNRSEDLSSELSKEIFINVQFASVLELKNVQIDNHELDLRIDKKNVYKIFNEYIELNSKLDIEGLNIFKFICKYLNIDSQEYNKYLLTYGKLQLSDSEMKYLDMVKIVVSDNNITDKEQEILNNYARSLGIGFEDQIRLEQYLLS